MNKSFPFAFSSWYLIYSSMAIDFMYGSSSMLQTVSSSIDFISHCTLVHTPLHFCELFINSRLLHLNIFRYSFPLMPILVWFPNIPSTSFPMCELKPILNNTLQYHFGNKKPDVLLLTDYHF